MKRYVWNDSAYELGSYNKIDEIKIKILVTEIDLDEIMYDSSYMKLLHSVVRIRRIRMIMISKMNLKNAVEMASIFLKIIHVGNN